MWTTLIDSVLREITPTRAQFADARRRADHIARILQNDANLGVLSIEYSGSFAKGTVTSPLNDVDLALYLDRTHWRGSDGQRLKPSIVLGRILARVKKLHKQKVEYGFVRFRRQPHSVRVIFEKEGVAAIDLVPILSDGNAQGVGRLPVRGSGKWVQTSVRLQLRAITKRDTPSGVLAKTIRLLKTWRTGYRLEFRSYAIELLACHIISSLARPTVRGLFTGTLEYIESSKLREPVLIPDHYPKSAFKLKRHAVRIMDVANPNNNVANNMIAPDRAAAVDAAIDALGWIDRTQESLDAGRHTADRWWRRAFGGALG